MLEMRSIRQDYWLQKTEIQIKEDFIDSSQSGKKRYGATKHWKIKIQVYRRMSGRAAARNLTIILVPPFLIPPSLCMSTFLARSKAASCTRLQRAFQKLPKLSFHLHFQRTADFFSSSCQESSPEGPCVDQGLTPIPIYHGQDIGILCDHDGLS